MIVRTVGFRDLRGKPMDCPCPAFSLERIKIIIDREDAMCRMFAHQPQSNYDSQTRSLRIGGHSTSIRLETIFWTILEEIAAREQTSVGKFITTLHDEVLLHHGNVTNLASLLRCSCLLYASKNAADQRPPPAEAMSFLTAAE
jgi:predicted DNA-binding ribbon-helix-helix protein